MGRRQSAVEEFFHPGEEARGFRIVLLGGELLELLQQLALTLAELLRRLDLDLNVEISAGASQVAALPAVREALLFRQRAFNKASGLVGDGRDMGSVVFPRALLKVFLTASAEARAERRYKQLIEKGFSANLPDLLLDLRQRDDRDFRRSVAPLKQEEDARLLDTTDLTIEQAVNQILAWSREALQ